MHQQLLNDFLTAHPIREKTPSAAAITHILLKNITQDDPIDLASLMDQGQKALSPARQANLAQGKTAIDQATTGAQVVKLMRKEQENANHMPLIQKALAFEGEIMLDILGRFKTNMTDHFIELAAQFFAKATTNPAEEIIGYFDQMKNPYGQSVALIVLGFRAGEEHIPWMIEKYHQLKKQYPAETFYQGAYFGLIEMEVRF